MLLGDCSDPVVQNSQKAVQTAWKNVPEVHSPLKNLQSHLKNRQVYCNLILLAVKQYDDIVKFIYKKIMYAMENEGKTLLSMIDHTTNDYPPPKCLAFQN